MSTGEAGALKSAPIDSDGVGGNGSLWSKPGKLELVNDEDRLDAGREEVKLCRAEPVYS